MGDHNPYIPSLKYLAIEMRRTYNWMRKALCARPEYKEYLWFPPRNEMSKKARLANRKTLQKICTQCPVQAECHEFAETAGVTAGVWAGKYYGG